MPAALLMSSLQARLQVLSEIDLAPAILVRRLNQGLTAKTPGNRFITFFFSIYDPDYGRTDLLQCRTQSAAGAAPRRKHRTAGGGRAGAGLGHAAPYEEGRSFSSPAKRSSCSAMG